MGFLLPDLNLLRSSVLDTGTGQTDSGHQCIIPTPWGGGIINIYEVIYKVKCIYVCLFLLITENLASLQSTPHDTYSESALSRECFGIFIRTNLFDARYEAKKSQAML